MGLRDLTFLSPEHFSYPTFILFPSPHIQVPFQPHSLFFFPVYELQGNVTLLT